MNRVYLLDVAAPTSGSTAATWLLLIAIVVIVAVPFLIGLMLLLRFLRRRKLVHEPKPAMRVEKLPDQERGEIGNDDGAKVSHL